MFVKLPTVRQILSARPSFLMMVDVVSSVIPDAAVELDSSYNGARWRRPQFDGKLDSLISSVMSGGVLILQAAGVVCITFGGREEPWLRYVLAFLCMSAGSSRC